MNLIKDNIRSELFYRTITTIIVLPLVFAVIIMGPLFLSGLAVIVTALAYWEYFQIINTSTKNFSLALGTLLACFLPIISYWGPNYLLIALSIYLVIFFIFCLIFKLLNIKQNIRFLDIIGIVCIGVPISFAILINKLTEDNTFLFLIIAIVFASDSFSYFTGKLIGKHFLVPSISSGKTWEGLIGGFSGALITAYLFPLMISMKLEANESLLIGLTIGVIAPIGDLIESKFKRSFNVKNSGILIPGHGGILDRLDSLGFGFIGGYFIMLLVL